MVKALKIDMIILNCIYRDMKNLNYTKYALLDHKKIQLNTKNI